MKKGLSLIIAALIVSFACFAVMYWLVGSDAGLSLSVGLAAGAAGWAVEGMKPYLKRNGQRRRGT